MKIGVIGAGAAGLIAGAFAAKGGARVDIIDRNEKTGKKLFLTGKGRCNITNSADIDAFLKNVPHNGRFLYSAFDGFFNDDIIELINSCGVRTKLERGGRYFPESDKSSDVIRALQTNAVRCGANIVLNSRVSGVLKAEDGGFRLCFENGQQKYYDKIIVATGGASYPSTGSTGDGYRFAEHLGHTVAAPKPSLIPLVANEAWVGDLMGLSLKNVVLRAYAPEKSKKTKSGESFPGKYSANESGNAEKGGYACSAAENTAKIEKKQKKRKPVYEELGEMLFTHFGVSGPLVLSASSYLADSPNGALLEIDLKPGLTAEQLDLRILRDFEKHKHKQVQNAMCDLLPQRLIDAVLHVAGVDAEITVDNLTREQRGAIVRTLKCLPLTVRAARPVEEAIITRGGVLIKEINPSTMESRIVPGLYFAGEVIDVDACTGGFNLQIAWSTGCAAGRAAAEAL